LHLRLPMVIAFGDANHPRREGWCQEFPIRLWKR
jgi:hypothetical protein